jgi:ATPase subunit of ABC transporter with duplicated ATPase domains
MRLYSWRRYELLATIGRRVCIDYKKIMEETILRLSESLKHRRKLDNEIARLQKMVRWAAAHRSAGRAEERSDKAGQSSALGGKPVAPRRTGVRVGTVKFPGIQAAARVRRSTNLLASTINLSPAGPVPRRNGTSANPA